MEIADEGGDEGVPGVGDEDLGGGDDGLDVLEVDDDRPLPPEDRGGVGEEGVENPKIPRGEPRAAHDRVLPHLLEPRSAGVGDDEPLPAPAALPPRGGPRRSRRHRRRGAVVVVREVVVGRPLLGAHLVSLPRPRSRSIGGRLLGLGFGLGFLRARKGDRERERAPRMLEVAESKT